MKSQSPYFESVNKKLPYSPTAGNPHIFCKFETPIFKDRVQFVTLCDIEVLSGQWSYCKSNALVYNCDKEYQILENNTVIDGDANEKEMKTSVVNTNPLLYSKVDINDLLDHIDIKHCD